MKKLFLSLFAVMCVAVSHAQIKQLYVGTAGRNEIATGAVVLPDSSTVVAGYSWSLTGNTIGTISNSDILIFRMLGNSIMWQRTISTGQNDFIHEIIRAANGDIIAVGTIGRGAAYNQTNNAVIFRIDANTGNILWQHVVRDVDMANVEGEIFLSVCERPNGEIVAVGAHGYNGGVSDGLICTYTPTLNPISVHRRGRDQSNLYTGVTNGPNNNVLLAGYYFDDAGSSLHKLTISEFDPTAVNMLWEQQYDVQEPNMGNSVGGRIWFIKGTIMVDGWISNDCCGANDMRQIILRTDQFGNSPTVSTILNSKTYANTFRTWPLGNNAAYITECPANSAADPHWNGYSFAVDGNISHVTNLTAGTVNFTRQMNIVGNHSLMDLKLAMGYLHTVGGASNSPYNIGGKDIYFIRSIAAVTPDPGDTCNKPLDTVYTIGHPTVVNAPYQTNPSTFPLRPQMTVSVSIPALTVATVCTSVPPPPCAINNITYCSSLATPFAYTFTPTVSSPTLCIKWRVNGVPVGTTTGNAPFSYTFPTSSTATSAQICAFAYSDCASSTICAEKCFTMCMSGNTGAKGSDPGQGNLEIKVEDLQSIGEVYPNPADNVLNIPLNDYTGTVTVALYDIRGALLSTQGSTVSSRGSVMKVNTKSLLSGSYIIEIQTANGTSRKRFSKL